MWSQWTYNIIGLYFSLDKNLLLFVAGINVNHISRHRWCKPLIPTIRRQRQVDLCQSKSSLIYTVSSRIARELHGETLKANKHPHAPTHAQSKQRLKTLPTPPTSWLYPPLALVPWAQIYLVLSGITHAKSLHLQWVSSAWQAACPSASSSPMFHF